MTSFDNVLPDVIRICATDASAPMVAKYCLVRDVKGRIRIVVESASKQVAFADLEAKLVGAIGKYFVGPIVSTSDSADVSRLAKIILEQAAGKWPKGWPSSYTNVLGIGATTINASVDWTGLERTIGKESWLSSPSQPPWPLMRGRTPPIATFHSYKGGVGRTTLVASYAIRLANDDPRRRIAIVDLDLEAPGVGHVFGVKTTRGVLDILVDHIATGELNLNGASANANVGHLVDQSITVFPAGTVNNTYVQKLARLDYSSTEPGKENPVGKALATLLLAIKKDFDIILLDSRAGLHDLAGMSLHGLAHVDILVLRGTDQNLVGLGQTLQTLGARGGDTQIVLVETMLSSNDDDFFESRRKRTREKVYELLLEHIYPEDDPPQADDIGEIHDVLPLRRKEWLEDIDSFNGRVERVLADAEIATIAGRISERCEIVGDAGSEKLEVDV